MVSLSYMAGFIDGEGSISIMKYQPNGRNCFSYKTTVTISNTHLGVLDEIASTPQHYGIKCQRWGKKRGHDDDKFIRRRPCYVLAVANEGVRQLLPLLDGKLVVKAEQAEAASMFLASFSPQSYYGIYLKPEVVDRRDYLIGYMQWLNKGKP